MSVEMTCLYAAMVLALVHLTAASFSYKAQVGNSYTVGPRDEDIRPAGLAGRLDRPQRNFLETFPVFVAAVIMIHILQRHGIVSSTAQCFISVAGSSSFRCTRWEFRGSVPSAGTLQRWGWSWS